MKRNDRQFMLRAIGLAKKAEGKTFPNPLVGAVIVKNGEIVGEGYHKKAGSPHAEIMAIKDAGKNTEGAHLYISLEPCAHHGRTPPCVNSIRKSGIKKVCVAMKDPNPLVNGKGVAFLRRNKIGVRSGICLREAKDINRSYIKRMQSGDVHGNR
jgi:diaminohydroxyphosphoribosylaminopyrimidine deaminase/5-amino-6-(5-phosphoribosylamino)uracil reductase